MMKNKMTKILGLGIILAAFSTGVNAQAVVTADVQATIIEPITITKVTDMNFGNVAVQVATGGTVVLDPAGTRTATLGVTLPTLAGTVSAGVFTVSGEGARTYTITLTDIPVTLENPAGDQMMVNTFISTPVYGSAGAGTLSGIAGSVGTQTLSVGATLNVAANQASGVYDSLDPFTVTVNYN